MKARLSGPWECPISGLRPFIIFRCCLWGMYDYNRQATEEFLADGFQPQAARSVAEATFKKLRDGNWGLLVNSTSVGPGDTVLTITKAGKRDYKTIGKVVWSGNGVSICTMVAERPSRPESRSAPNYRGPAGMYECEECGDYVKPGTRCWETGITH